MINKINFLKIFFVVGLFLSFFFAYIFKNFQLLMISFTFSILLGLKFKKLNKNFIIFFFSLFFSVSIVEIGLYLKGGKKFFPKQNENNFSQNIKLKKTYLGNQPLAGKQHHKVVSGGIKILDSYYTIKENNFRYTPSINEIKKEKTLNFFGGSQTFGWGLNDNETLPYLTQFHFKNWKINNYANGGWGAQQMLTQIKKEPEIINDINILITYIAHIPRATCKRDFTFGFPKYVLNKKNELIRSGYCNFGFLNKLPLPPIVGSVLNRSEIKKLFDKYYFRKSLFNKKDVDLYLAIIKEINKEILKKNKVFLIGYFDKKTKTDEYIKQNLISNSIEIIDLTLPNNAEYVIPNDGHATKKANVERALKISNHLDDLK